MRKFICGLLVVIFSAVLLGGCAQKEAVKTEEQIVPAVTAVPEVETPLVAPEPAQPSPTVKAEVVPEQVMTPEQTQKAAAAETEQKLILETIYFDFDKSDLREPDRDILTRNAGILMGKNKVNVEIEGHCDERGSAEYNIALGDRRARSAMQYLVTLGVSADRLSVISYGEENPVDPGRDEEAWAKNRRDEFVIMGK